MKPFDPRMRLRDDEGRPVRFINAVLDERYIVPPGDLVPEGLLPPEEFEVRRALAELNIFSERLMDFGFFRRLFDKNGYLHVERAANGKQEALRRLINASPEHRAAFRRIVNAMPEGNGGRENLISDLCFSTTPKTE